MHNYSKSSSLNLLLNCFHQNFILLSSIESIHSQCTGVGALLALVPAYSFKIGELEIRINPYTSPALVLFLMFVVGFIVVLLFKEVPHSQAEEMFSINGTQIFVSMNS